MNPVVNSPPNYPVQQAFPAAADQYADIVNNYAKKKALVDALRAQQTQLAQTPDANPIQYTPGSPAGTMASMNLGGILGNAARAYEKAKTSGDVQTAQSDQDAARYDALMRLVGDVPAGQGLNQAQNIALSQMGLDPTKFDPLDRKNATGGGTSGVMQEYNERVRIANDPTLSAEQKKTALAALDAASNNLRTVTGSNGYGVINLANPNAPVIPVTTAGGAPVLPVSADPNVAGANARASARGSKVGQDEGGNAIASNDAPIVFNQLNDLDQLLNKIPQTPALSKAQDTLSQYYHFPGWDEAQNAKGQIASIAAQQASMAKKMSGSQSDYDVRNYLQQMGSVTDDTKTVEYRRGALQRAMAYYQKLVDRGIIDNAGNFHADKTKPSFTSPTAAPTPAASSSAAPAAKVRTYNPQTGKLE